MNFEFGDIPVCEGRYSINLYPYQQEILRKIEFHMRQGVRKILIVLPTGGGKTVLAAAMIQSAIETLMTADFVAHRDPLISQTSKSFFEKGIHHSFIASGRETDPTELVKLCGIATLINNLVARLPPNLAILDEAHHAVSATWRQLIASYGDDTFVVGLTATPERLDGTGLGDIFDVMVEGPTTGFLIKNGYLSKYDYFAPHIPDVDGTKNDRHYSELLNSPKLIGNAVEHYLDLAFGEPGIMFAGSVKHSKELAHEFCQNHIEAVHIDGTMHRDHLREIDQALRDGQISMLCNVDLCGEGYDVPNLVYCGIVRVTNSLSLHRQMIGRVMRLKKGRAIRATISDHAGNALRGLGLPTSPVHWSLDSKSRRKLNGCNADSTPIHQCPECYLVTPSTVSVCPRCSHTFAVRVQTVKVAKGKLSKLEQAQLKAEAAQKRKAEERTCKSRNDLYQLALKRGYKDAGGWAFYQAKIRRWI